MAGQRTINGSAASTGGDRQWRLTNLSCSYRIHLSRKDWRPTLVPDRCEADCDTKQLFGQAPYVVRCRLEGWAILWQSHSVITSTSFISKCLQLSRCDFWTSPFRIIHQKYFLETVLQRELNRFWCLKTLDLRILLGDQKLDIDVFNGRSLRCPQPQEAHLHHRHFTFILKFQIRTRAFS